jgi:hypothetical protein
MASMKSMVFRLQKMWSQTHHHLENNEARRLNFPVLKVKVIADRPPIFGV